MILANCTAFLYYSSTVYRIMFRLDFCVSISSHADYDSTSAPRKKYFGQICMQLQSHNQNKVTLLEAPDCHLPRQDCSVSTRFTRAHVPHTLTQRHRLREDVHVDHET